MHRAGKAAQTGWMWQLMTWMHGIHVALIFEVRVLFATTTPTESLLTTVGPAHFDHLQLLLKVKVEQVCCAGFVPRCQAFLVKRQLDVAVTRHLLRALL